MRSKRRERLPLIGATSLVNPALMAFAMSSSAWASRRLT